MLVNSVYERHARVRCYAEHLADHGQQVDIVCPASDGESDSPQRHGIRVYALPIRRYRLEGLGLVFNWAFCAVMMFLWVTRLDLKNRYDLIHVHNIPDFLIFCALLPRLRGCPVILDVHDPVPELARSKLRVGKKHPIVRILTIIERLSIRFSSCVITAVPAFKKALVSRGAPPERITVLMTPAIARCFRIDDRDERPKGEDGRFTLLFVGTVAERYGLQVCVRALASVRKEIPEIWLRIVPRTRHEGKSLEDCLHLAEDLGVADLIEVLDPRPLEEMPEVMLRADIGVYPAISDCHMDVALSLKIPEMANMRLPIVATRLPVLEELYGDDAIAFVPSDDHEALASKILELYRSAELRETLADNALRRSSTLTWERQSDRYDKLLASLLPPCASETRCNGNSGS